MKVRTVCHVFYSRSPDRRGRHFQILALKLGMSVQYLLSDSPRMGKLWPQVAGLVPSNYGTSRPVHPSVPLEVCLVICFQVIAISHHNCQGIAIGSVVLPGIRKRLFPKAWIQSTWSVEPETHVLMCGHSTGLLIPTCPSFYFFTNFT